MKKLISKYRVELALFLLLLFSYTYFFPRWADWSQNSRLNLTLAIVDKGTLRIDDHYQSSGDYALFEGHYYTDKAPGPSFLAVPIYAIARPFLQLAPIQNILEKAANRPAFQNTLTESGTGLLKQKIYQATVLYIVTAIVVAVPAALLGVLLYTMLQIFDISVFWRVVIVLIYGLATPAFPYSGAFYSHQLAAFLLFAALYIGFLLKYEKISPYWVIPAGLILGYAIISEYPVFLIAGGIYFYIAYILYPSRQWIGILTLSGIPPGVVLMVYDWLIFRTPLPVAYKYSELFVEQHSTGFLSITYPHPVAIWGLTFGSFRGLFYISPILILAAAGFWVWWHMGKHRAEWTVCLWAIMSLFTFYSSSIMWQGGFSIASRYIVPFIPFLTMGLGAFVARWGEQIWAKVLIVIFSIWSVGAVWALTIAGQSFPDWTHNPLFNYSLPLLIEGNIARNLGMLLKLSGWVSIIPLIIGLGIGLGVLFKISRQQQVK